MHRKGRRGFGTSQLVSSLKGRVGSKRRDGRFLVPEVLKSRSCSALNIQRRLGRLVPNAEGTGQRRGDERLREGHEFLVGW